jgi:hypothetical protein
MEFGHQWRKIAEYCFENKIKPVQCREQFKELIEKFQVSKLEHLQAALMDLGGKVKPIFLITRHQQKPSIGLSMYLTKAI